MSYDTFIVTSNYSPCDLFGVGVDRDAIERRFKVIHFE